MTTGADVGQMVKNRGHLSYPPLPLILDAKKHPVIRKSLHSLLLELQYSIKKEGVTGHALDIVIHMS